MKLPRGLFKGDFSGKCEGADNTSSFINSFFPNYMASKDRITARKDKERSRQKLSEIFGGQPLPAVLQGMEDLPLDQAMGLIPAMGNMAYKQEMADVNRGRLAAVEQAAPIAQSQAERGLDIKTEQSQTEKQLAEAKLKEEHRQKEAAESQKRNELDLARLKKKRADLENFIAIANDPSQPFAVTDAAETNAKALSRELNEYYPIDGKLTDWYKTVKRTFLGKSSQFTQPNPSNVQPAPAAQPMRSANPAGAVTKKLETKYHPKTGEPYKVDDEGSVYNMDGTLK